MSCRPSRPIRVHRDVSNLCTFVHLSKINSRGVAILEKTIMMSLYCDWESILGFCCRHGVSFPLREDDFGSAVPSVWGCLCLSQRTRGTGKDFFPSRLSYWVNWAMIRDKLRCSHVRASLALFSLALFSLATRSGLALPFLGVEVWVLTSTFYLQVIWNTSFSVFVSRL